VKRIAKLRHFRKQYDVERNRERQRQKRSIIRVRMIDGQCNDFDNPASGSVHYRFGQYMNYKAKLFSALFAINGNVMAKRSI
jgi:hypothetical protein